MKNLIVLTVLVGFFLMSSCDNDDDGSNDPLTAIASFDTAYSVGSIVTLDASGSRGIDGAQVQWIYKGAPMDESEIRADTAYNSLDMTTSFVAKRNGFYSFGLRITKGGRFSETTFGFNVSGILEITDLSQLEDFKFENLDNSADPDVGDYLINTVLVIPDDGNSYQIQDGATILFGENGGLDVQGNLRNSADGPNAGNFVYLNALNNPWKGIMVSGALNIQNLEIANGGATSFTTEPDDAANLYLDGEGRLNSERVSLKTSSNFGIVVNRSNSQEIVTFFDFGENKNTGRIGAKFLQNFPSIQDQENARLEIFYEELVTSSQIPILNDLTILDSLVIKEGGFAFQNVTVKFRAGSYVRCFDQFQQSTNISGCEFIPEDPNPAAKWRGVSARRMTIENSTFSGAGNGLLPGASEPAAVYVSDRNGLANRIENSTFSDNNGRAIFSLGEVGEISSCTFSNNNISHIKMPYGSADAFNTQVNTFDGNIVAVELIETDGGGSPGLRTQEEWASLGGNNYYLCDADMFFNTWSLASGTHIKMKLDKFIRAQNNFEAEGTMSNPIIIESDLGLRGDWQGIQILDDASMNFVQLKDAGRNSGTTTFSTPFGASLVVNSAPNSNVSVTNCNIENAGEYGVIIQMNAGDFGIDSTASANTLEGALGGYLDLN